MPAHRRDLTNQRFGLLLVLEPSGSTARKAVIWRCRCDCGNYRDVLGTELTAEHAKHCGCLTLRNRINNLNSDRNCKDSMTKKFKAKPNKKLVRVQVPNISSVIDSYLRTYRHGQD